MKLAPILNDPRHDALLPLWYVMVFSLGASNSMICEKQLWLFLLQ
tara:strand:+ start:148 stop:282 length:135 start_codon:yes stop_codon:yes gene_type:complete